MNTSNTDLAENCVTKDTQSWIKDNSVFAVMSFHSVGFDPSTIQQKQVEINVCSFIVLLSPDKRDNEIQ